MGSVFSNHVVILWGAGRILGAATGTWQLLIQIWHQKGTKRETRGAEVTWNWTHLRCVWGFHPHWFWISVSVSMWCLRKVTLIVVLLWEKHYKRLRSWRTHSTLRQSVSIPNSTCCFHNFTSQIFRDVLTTDGCSVKTFTSHRSNYTSAWLAVI